MSFPAALSYFLRQGLLLNLGIRIHLGRPAPESHLTRPLLGLQALMACPKLMCWRFELHSS